MSVEPTFDQDPSSVREADLTRRLMAFNRTHNPRWNQNHDSLCRAEPLHVFACDEQGKLIGYFRKDL